MNKNIEPKTEAISRETKTFLEYQFYDKDSKPAHKSMVIYKNMDKIVLYPFSYNEDRGVQKKAIPEIVLIGWSKYEDIPKEIKPGKYISLSHKKIDPLMRALRKKFPKIKKLVVSKGGKSSFTQSTATFRYEDLVVISKAITKEINIFDERKKIAARNALSEVSNKFSSTTAKLSKGDLFHFLSFHEGEIDMSSADTDALLKLISHIPITTVSVTQNFIETKNKVNVAYLDQIIEEYEKLLSSKADNEKAWQKFFGEHGWILASVFPYQVILREKEAYVGGKTIEDKEGRVVDFLYQNGFQDNYALLEIKTHVAQLMAANPYRKPHAYAQHKDCSGAVSQCLDQKNIFTTSFGRELSTLDPKVALIIGCKNELKTEQIPSFELMRNNQKNVDIITFDEVLEKVKGLRSILQGQVA